MTFAEQNHSVISQNIANVNTPDYKTRHLNFEEFLKQVENGKAKQGKLGSMPVELTTGLDDRADGNNVNIDQQLAALRKNSLLFQTFSNMLNSRMDAYRRAISG